MPGEYRVTNQDFVITQESLKPPQIILTVPHATLKKMCFPFYQERRIGVGGREENIILLVNTILGYAKSADRISVVQGLVHRKILDYNRPEEVNSPFVPQPYLEDPAYIDDRLSDFYWKYHNTIERLLCRGIKEYGKGGILLIDLHNFGRQPEYAPDQGFDVILGTANRQTILHSNPDQQLGAYLQQSGFNVFIPREQPLRSAQSDLLSGHYTIRRYSQVFGINAIQLEEDIKLTRKTPEISNRGLLLSQLIADFLGQYKYINKMVN